MYYYYLQRRSSGRQASYPKFVVGGGLGRAGCLTGILKHIFAISDPPHFCSLPLSLSRHQAQSSQSAGSPGSVNTWSSPHQNGLAMVGWDR